MTMSAQTIFDAALALPEAERAALVERLLESLPSEPGELSDEDWVAELERRSADFGRGSAGAISWSQLKQEE